jgi:uncharacterized protein (TIGR03382 family)
MLSLNRSRSGRTLLPVLAPVLAIGAIGIFTPASARAHFILDQPALPGQPACWMSEDSQGVPEKVGPCGNEGGGTPTGKVTAFQSGQTITLTINEVIQHSGWYRVAIAPGPASSQTLASLPDPVVTTTCTPAIESSPTLPILVDGKAHGSQSLQVTLPRNMACTPAGPCTLQVIEVMTDHSPPSCFYHHCADITIESAVADGGGADAGAASSPGDASSVDGGGGEDASTGGAAPSSGGGGCVISAGGGAPAAAGLAGFIAVAAVMRRRRRG